MKNIEQTKPKRRNRVLTWLLIGAGVIVALPVLVMIIGNFMPAEFEAQAQALLPCSVDDAWLALADFQKNPISAQMRRKTEALASENGLPAWREDIGSTRHRVQTLESEQPRRLVRLVQDEIVPMSMRCEYTLTPRGGQTELAIRASGSIQRGTWHVPIFRFMVHTFGGIRAGQEQFARQLRVNIENGLAARAQ